MEPGSAAANMRRLVLGPALVVLLLYAMAFLGGGALVAFLDSPIDSAFTAFVAIVIGVLGCGLVLRAVTRWAWREGSSSTLLTGFLAMCALGLVGGSVLLVEIARALVESKIERQALRGPVASALPLGPGNSIGPVLPATLDPFHACLNQLSDEETLDAAKRAAFLAGSYAGDVVQDILLTVCAKHARRAVWDLRPYFIRSVKQEAWNVAMGQSNPVSCPLEEVCDRNPESDYLRSEALEIVKTALCELESPQQREVLRLRHLGWSYREIGASLKITEATARQLYKRGIDRIRDRISLHEIGCEFRGFEE